jgi:hypothetical protein
VDNVSEQKRLICSIIEKHKEESARAENRAQDHLALQNEHAALKEAHLELQTAQAEKSPDFVLHNGVRWRKTANGFEPFPYCNECGYQAVMRRPTPMARFWVCSQGHMAPLTGPPK